MIRFNWAYSVFVSLLALNSPCIADDAATELFQSRIMPIFRSPNPSSCIQCHLSAVDLKDYILPSHQATFVSLRDQGLIDLKNPSESKILKLIRMGDEDRDVYAKRIHAKMRQAEYDAFAAWIIASCDDPKLTQLTASKPVAHAKPEASAPVIRHTRKDRLLDSFVRNVWSQRMRCFPCHTPGEIDDENPLHEKPRERYDNYVKQYGAKMNLFRHSPAETMMSMINSSRRPTKKHLPMLNFADPSKSLLVLKPTAKVPAKTEDGTIGKPSSTAPVSHMGGLKMHVDDQSYKSMLHWIEDCAKTISDGYKTADEIPQDNWHPTRHLIRVKQTPESWSVGTVVQLFVHRWDASKQDWQANPIAFTQGTVTPRRFVNGALFVLDRNAAEDAPDESGGYRMHPGRMLIKAYVDKDSRVRSQPSALLGDEEYQGQVEIDAAWGVGFKEAEIVDGPLFR